MAQWTFNAPSNGYKFRITLTDVNTNIPGNYSQVAWVIEHYQATTSYNGTMNRFLVIEGQTVYSVNGNYNTTVYPYNSWWTVASGTTGNIGHNPDGTKTVSVQFYWSGTSGGFGPGTVNQSWTFALNTIPRYANITGLSSSSTDVAVSANVSVDAVCDLISLSINNGASYPYVLGGDYTNKTITTTGQLPSNTTYNCYVAVRRKDSGLTTYSSPFTVTTGSQNNFMGFL